MKAADLCAELEQALSRPAPFSVYTADALWTDPHTSEQMLRYHLDPDVDLSSRRTSFIDESAGWMVERFGLGDGRRVIDFGCGPGLYASRFAAAGARVTGVDFSPTSLRYARKQADEAGHDIAYQQANYLEFEPPGTFDLVTMIMCDFCAMSPDQRGQMLDTFRHALAPDGRIVFDVYSLEALKQKEEVAIVEENMLDGFWSPLPYFGILARFKYKEERVSLDKYTIVDEQAKREVFNWLQYFTPESLEQMLRGHGLAVEALLGNVAGHQFDPAGTEFAIVAVKD